MGHRPADSWAKPPTEPACPPPRAGKLRLSQLPGTKFPRTKNQIPSSHLDFGNLVLGWVARPESAKGVELCSHRGGFRRLHPPYKPQGVPPGPTRDFLE